MSTRSLPRSRNVQIDKLTFLLTEIVREHDASERGEALSNTGLQHERQPARRRSYSIAEVARDLVRRKGSLRMILSVKAIMQGVAVEIDGRELESTVGNWNL